jgi:murein DD-endopeptidase MepM/ murein hydrolase activator NlpD
MNRSGRPPDPCLRPQVRTTNAPTHPHTLRWALCGILIQSGAACATLDRSPPVVEFVGMPPADPSSPVAGTVILQAVAHDPAGRWPASGVVEVRIEADGRELARGPVPLTVRWEATGRAEGEHNLQAMATDGAGNIGFTQAMLHTDDRPPGVAAGWGPEQPTQGRATPIFVRFDEPIGDAQIVITETETAQTLPLYPVENGLYRAILGIGVGTPIGPFPVAIHAADRLGNTTRCTLTLTVQAGEFPSGGQIRLSKGQIAARNDKEAIDKMRAERKRAYTFIDPQAHWTGPIQVPVSGRRSSAFGRYRTYSDGRKSHHLGTDLAAPTGTPVVSALDGVVRSAGWHHLFGNAVIVGHGQGLSTSYNHLSSITVQDGTEVRAGDTIGAVGSTGQSTGPHLHWGMQVGLIEVDPEAWPSHGFQPAQLGEIRLDPVICE